MAFALIVVVRCSAWPGDEYHDATAVLQRSLSQACQEDAAVNPRTTFPIVPSNTCEISSLPFPVGCMRSATTVEDHMKTT